MVGKTVAHYRILEKLGGGGMGVVYKAENIRLGSLVALKFLPEGLSKDRQALERFQREARAASALNHPNIITIYDIDEAEGVHFIAMEYVQGKTFGQLLARHGLPVGEVLRYAVQIAGALARAHSAGIVHRDLKPSNVMVTDEGLVKVLDFGLAKLTQAAPTSAAETVATAEPITEDGTIVGTVGYMSPEQAEGKPVDARSDIFSFGSVLYEMLTGQRAFRGETKASTIAAILKEEPKPLSEVAASLPHEVERLVKRCLRKDREHRFQTMADLKVALEELKEESDSGELGTAPVAAVSDRRTAVRTSPVQGRWAVAAGVALVVLVALLLGLNVGGFRDRLLPRGAATPKIESIAVLPLANLSGDPEQEYFADGMTEALITELGQIGSLRVISRTSAMRYKKTDKPLPQIARELNVDAVIEGSVFRSGDRVRVTAQLIGAVPERHLWARSYERELRDVLSLQSEVASAIATEVKANVTPDVQARLASARFVNPEAHDSYLQGRFFFSKTTEEGYKKASEYARQAVQIEPDFAPAYGLLASSSWMLSQNAYGNVPDKEAAEKTKAAAMKALAIDDTLAEPHVALGMVLKYHDWDWAGAERELRRAVELNPSLALAHGEYAWYLAMMGRKGEAIREASRAVELDPFSVYTIHTLASMYYYGRQYDLALEHIRKCAEMFPDNLACNGWLTTILEANGVYDQEIAAWQKTMTLDGEKPEKVAALGEAYKVGGIRAAWQWEIGRLKGTVGRNEFAPTAIAARYASLGEKDQALAWLEKGYEDHADDMYGLKAAPWWDPLRSDPRFQALLRRMNFPP